MTPKLAYEDFVDFIAAGTTPQSILDFKHSQYSCERLADLLRRRKADGLSNDEESELRHCLSIEHLMRLAKARIRQIIASE